MALDQGLLLWHAKKCQFQTFLLAPQLLILSQKLFSMRMIGLYTQLQELANMGRHRKALGSTRMF